MGRLLSVALWFMGLALTSKILLPDRPLGYFWLMVLFLSLFFGFSCSGRKKRAPEDFDYQQKIWWDKYHSFSYYERQKFLTETVNNAIKINQLEPTEKFLQGVINSEPDNELAQSLLISIWGSEVINKGKWNSKKVHGWNNQNINQ
jgi:hypothetical protein